MWPFWVLYLLDFRVFWTVVVTQVLVAMTKWFSLSRLETRTKESNMCASLRVIETRRHNESKGSFELT